MRLFFEEEKYLTSIGENAFRGCSLLTKVVTTSIKNWLKIPFNNALANPLYYAKHLYIDNEEVTEITDLQGVTSISSYAFSGCLSLREITIPNSVTNIGDYVFYNCTSLTDITIPNSVTNIGANAFFGCSSLTIYCEVASQPSGWNSNWNSSNRPVYWYSQTQPTEVGNYWHYGADGKTPIIW